MEPAESDLRNLFLIYYEVVRFCEGFYISSDINTLFKSAKLLENTYLKLESIDALNDFESKLNEFWTLKEQKVIPLKYFEKVSHEVLSRVITDPNFSNDVVKSAINEFLILNSEEEFLEVVKKLYFANQSVEILKQSRTNISDYNTLIILEEISKRSAIGDIDVEESTTLLTSLVSRDTNNFKLCLRLLCKNSVCNIFEHLKELIVVIANFLSQPDNVHLYQLIFELSDAEFCLIVTSWDSVLESFIKMIEYSIVKLKCNYSHSSYLWINTGDEKCLTFKDLVTLISKIKLESKAYNQLQEHLNQLKHRGHGVVVDDVLMGARTSDSLAK